MTAKITALCASAALLTLQLPACNFSMSVDTMLSPPRLTLEQEQIYQALQSAAGSGISLKYPKSGERLSAFTVEDLDSDGTDEAIVFYEAPRSSEEENPLRLCLLDQQNGSWRAIREYPAAGAEIERVDVERLGTNPRKNLIVSYGLVDGADHAADLFHYEDGSLVHSLSVTYSKMELRDLDSDGAPELFTASAAKAPAPAQAMVYSLDETGQYVQSPLALPESFTDVSRLLFGTMPTQNGDVPAVYMDGATGATTAQTAVLIYQDMRLSLAYADTPDRFPNTARQSGYVTADIDGDGEPEIPVNTMFYGYSEASPLSMTNWYVCRNGLLMRDHSSYYSVAGGYVFLMPQKWENRVTAVQENEEVVFYEFDKSETQEDGTPVLKTPLLRLAAVSDPIAADAMLLEGYSLLRRRNGMYYLGLIRSQEGTLSLSESELLFAMQYL